GPVRIALVLGDRTEDQFTTALARAATSRAIAGALGSLPDDIPVTFWFIMRPSGSLPSPEEPLEPSDAAVWGLSRSLANENPRLNVRRMSFAVGGGVTEAAGRIAAELLTPSNEDEILLTPRGRFVPRFVQYEPGDYVTGGQIDKANPPTYALEL